MAKLEEDGLSMEELAAQLERSGFMHRGVMAWLAGLLRRSRGDAYPQG